MSKQYKLVFLARFLGYFGFIAGLVVSLAIFGPIVQVEASYRLDKLFGVKRAVPTIITSSSGTQISNESGSSASGFEALAGSSDAISPVDTEFGIVIEKINANAKVVANVDPTNEKAYTQALSKGVAHAAGTNFPGEKGNIYLFSHSTDAPWNIVRFNAVFYLLRELEPGDRVVMFYQDRRFDYIVFDKSVISPKDVSFLTNKYDQSVLTLQTCDPPGTVLNRLIVRAKLQGS